MKGDTRQRPATTADFTSALVLGLRHPSPPLSWNTLTTGTPAALRPAEHAARAARAFAALAGCDDAVVVASTLHAFSDLFGELWKPPAVIFHDQAIYPIARWGMERAQQRGARVVPFPHLDAAVLGAALRQLPLSSPSPTAGPWIVTDGMCAGCGRPAPLQAYAALARQRGGLVIVDDAQAIGLHGRTPGVDAPYGRGGGGSLARLGLGGHPSLVLVASLAKAFGAPLALVAGPRSFIARFRADSETLVHCSPPSQPVLIAARNALALAGADADALRARLATRVRRLRRALQAHGFPVRGGLSPMQRVPMPDGPTALALRERLARQGVQAVVRRARCTDELSLTFIVTANHSDQQLHLAATALAAAVRDCPGFPPPIASSSPSLNLEA